MLSLRTVNEPRPEVEECPFCGTAIRPGAIVCAACGAFKGKRMGLSGWLALSGLVVCTSGALVMVALFSGVEHPVSVGFIILSGLIYAGVAALCYGALPGKRGLKWCRRV